MPIPEFKPTLSDDELEDFVAQDRQLLAELAYYRELRDRFPEMSEAERSQYRDPNELIAEFRQRVSECFEHPPLSKEEIEKAFTAENLSQLTLDEYVKLLRKVPAQFVTHITRHGFRDRRSHHNDSEDASFHRGFEGALATKHLQSALDQVAQGHWDRPRVQSVLAKIGIPDTYGNKSDARHRLKEFLDLRSPFAYVQSEFADNNAIHGAIDHVADWYYGGETGNQIFVLYPAAFIASQYRCAHQNGGVPDAFFEKEENRHHDKNDLWMMDKDKQRGALPLDAGIVFIPANARVNPDNGSQYHVGQDGFRLEGNPKVEEAVSSQEYWENYFKKTGYRPSKIIYYDQEDPNEALADFRAQARLAEDLHKGVNLKTMFSENMLSQVQMKEALSEQRSAFRAIAEKLIDEMY